MKLNWAVRDTSSAFESDSLGWLELRAPIHHQIDEILYNSNQITPTGIITQVSTCTLMPSLTVGRVG